MLDPQRQREIVQKQIQTTEAVQQFSEALEKKDLVDLLLLNDMLNDMHIVLENELIRRRY